MSVNDVVNEILARHANVGAVVVFKNDGTIVHTAGQWQLNPNEIIDVIKNKKPSIVIQGVKYSVLTNTEDSFTASNLQGLGHVIGAAIDEKGWVIVYASKDADMKEVLRTLLSAANKLNAII
ncbi:MAG: hypothetical protein ACP6IS_05770 [Candidatus Asgardarchaeia archaeon]